MKYRIKEIIHADGKSVFYVQKKAIFWFDVEEYANSNSYTIDRQWWPRKFDSLTEAREWVIAEKLRIDARKNRKPKKFIYHYFSTAKTID